MEQYYDLVMASTLRQFAKKGVLGEIKKLTPGVAPKGASEAVRWKTAKDAFYGTTVGVISEWGLIDFNPRELATLTGGGSLSYDEYLDIMKASGNQVRRDFSKAYYDGADYSFKGRVQRVNEKNGKVCFQRIHISGVFRNNTMQCFTGKEDHVWMDLAGFPHCKKGDCFQFYADIYRYLKTGNGKKIDFGLRNPNHVERIDHYILPTDAELLRQEIDELICHNLCLYKEHCTGFCIANQEWRQSMRAMFLGKESTSLK